MTGFEDKLRARPVSVYVAMPYIAGPLCVQVRQTERDALADAVAAARALVDWWMENDVPTREVADLRDALARLDAA